MENRESQRDEEERGSRIPRSYPCETCLCRACVIDGVLTDSPDSVCCDRFPEPGRKPPAVYLDGADCLLYQKADDKALAMIFGVAVGDALGVPWEGAWRGKFRATGMTAKPGRLPGVWSDDTSMTLALADALPPSGERPDLRRVADNFLAWFDRGRFTPLGKAIGSGRRTRQALRRLRSGTPPLLAGGRDVSDNGNGSLMRTSPLTFFVAGIEKAEDRYAIVRDISSVTHAHEWSTAACHIYVEMLNRLRDGMEKEKAYAGLREEFAGGVPFISAETMEKFDRIIRRDIRRLSERDLETSAFVIDTLEASLWCLLTTDSYRDAVLRAVNLGRDSDTTAAVTGAMAGLAYGLEAIPREWIDALVRPDIIRDIAVRIPRWDLFRR